jgi:hypothetical protein
MSPARSSVCQSSALANPDLLVRKRADEATLRRQIAARSELAKRYRGAWDAIAKAVRGKREPWLRAAAFNRLTASQLLGQALTLVRLPAVLGERVYPDATFTLRVSYGTVKGWREGDHDVRPFTTLGGRASHRFGTVRAAQTLDGTQGVGRARHAVQPVSRYRHHRRQLGVADDRP